MDRVLSSAGRKYIYGVAASVVSLLVVLGVLSSDVAPLWLVLVGAVLALLGNITAVSFTDSTFRASLYGVSVAVVALLVAYRILDGGNADAVVSVLAAVFGVGPQALALKNVTPDAKPDELFDGAEPLIEGQIIEWEAE